MIMASLKGIYTVQTAAEKLGISDSYLRKLCIDHEIGQRAGHPRLLTDADLTKLRKLPKKKFGPKRKF